MPTHDLHTPQKDQGTVLLEKTGAIATITFSRPAALNALTWSMYEQLETHLEELKQDEQLRVLVLRGAGKAFAAGTDITQFQAFNSAEGLTYERKMEDLFERIHAFSCPVIAAIHGYAVGAGCILASVSDLRYATPTSRFGVPIARTMGNALSANNYRRLMHAFGPMRAKEMLLTARLLSAQEAHQCGFLTAILDEEQIFTHVSELARHISSLAPLTLWAAKEAHHRIATEDAIPFDDVMTKIYASSDFAEGIRAYVEKRKPQWQGQ